MSLNIRRVIQNKMYVLILLIIYSINIERWRCFNKSLQITSFTRKKTVTAAERKVQKSMTNATFLYQ